MHNSSSLMAERSIMQPLSKLSYKEKRKKLITEITKKTSGVLNSTEINEIVSKLNVNLPYQLEFIHSYEKMEKILTLKQLSPDDSPHTFYTKEYGKILLGTASFGLLKDGILEAHPILDMQQKLVILIDHHNFCSYEGICNKLGKTLTIVIYIPGI